jgi:hypothetical protein
MITFLKRFWPLLVTAVLAVSGAWYLWGPKPPVQEVYKAPVVQKDGSLILEKKPDATAKPKQFVPKGSTVERIIQVTVKAKEPTPGSEKKTCSPVNVDVTLVKNKDESRSVVVSSDDGVILGGVDIPVEAAKPIVPPKLWAAGAVMDPFKRTYGVFVDRDIAWFRVGAQITQRDSGDLPNQVMVKFGIKF